MKTRLIIVMAVVTLAWPAHLMAQTPGVTVPPAEETKTDVAFSGTITALDRVANTVTVKGPTTRLFRVSPAADIVIAGMETPSLADLKVGDDVAITYSQVGNDFNASRIERTTAKDAKK